MHLTLEGFETWQRNQKEQFETSSGNWENYIAGGMMKEAGFEHWGSPNTGATNSSGFTALPAAYRLFTNGAYANIGYVAYFWSSSDTINPLLMYNGSNFRWDISNLAAGFSIRCLKD